MNLNQLKNFYKEYKKRKKNLFDLNFFKKALEMDPNNTKIMDFYAVFLLDLDDFEGAKNVLFILK